MSAPAPTAQRMCSGIDVIVGTDGDGAAVFTCATCELPIHERPLELHPCFQPPADEDAA